MASYNQMQSEQNRREQEKDRAQKERIEEYWADLQAKVMGALASEAERYAQDTASGETIEKLALHVSILDQICKQAQCGIPTIYTPPLRAYHVAKERLDERQR